MSAEASFHHFLSEVHYYFNHPDYAEATRKALQESFVNRYQEEAFTYALPAAQTHAYVIPGLAAEAGEVVGKWAKYIRDGGTFPTEDVMKEVGDVLWFCAAIATLCEIPLSRVMQGNLDKLAGRKARGTIGGSGDER